MAVARSGTTSAPAPPPARLNAIRPSLVDCRISQPSVVAESAASGWSGFEGMPARSVPPLTGGPPLAPEPPAEPDPPHAPATATARTARVAATACENALIGGRLYSPAAGSVNSL